MRRRRLPGSHRSGLTELGSSAVSAVAVIALVAVLLLMFGQRADHLDAVDRVAATDAPSAPAQPPLPVAPAPGTGDVADALPGPIVGYGPHEKVSPDKAPGMPADQSAAGPTAPGVVTPGVVADDPATGVSVPYEGPKVPIVLFNQTADPARMSSLQTALVAAGWPVSATDTWKGKVPQTTVYYPVGMMAQAKALMAQFPTIGRIRPVFAGIPQTGKLTVIICDDRTATTSAPD
ncbi:MAG TPA: LytR C-terminal domain-containing protein [Sporichthyaceae bacterium]|nr:LytR C-terminal domain-containing protein [Sporichthyaceae bacterium]